MWPVCTRWYLCFSAALDCDSWLGCVEEVVSVVRTRRRVTESRANPETSVSSDYPDQPLPRVIRARFTQAGLGGGAPELRVRPDAPAASALLAHT